MTKFGRLDVVVSNAGWTRITNFANLDEGMVEEDWVSPVSNPSQRDRNGLKDHCTCLHR